MVYSIPVGMCACQIWGKEYLEEGREFGSQLQKLHWLHLCALRHILAVKKTSCQISVIDRLTISDTLCDTH